MGCLASCGLPTGSTGGAAVYGTDIQPVQESINSLQCNDLGPIGHTIVSSAVAGGVYLATKSPGAAGITVGVGVLLDLDHLFDLFRWYAKPNQSKVYVPLHAWEYAIIGWRFWVGHITTPCSWRSSWPNSPTLPPTIFTITFRDGATSLSTG